MPVFPEVGRHDYLSGASVWKNVPCFFLADTQLEESIVIFVAGGHCFIEDLKGIRIFLDLGWYYEGETMFVDVPQAHLGVCCDSVSDQLVRKSPRHVRNLERGVDVFITEMWMELTIFMTEG